jgi:hypothetical protein
VSETNGTSEDLRVDLMIDNVIAGGDLALTGVSPDEILVRRLSRLDEIDWPAEEVGDRIAASVAAPVLAAAERHQPARRRRPGARHPRSARSRWLVAGVAAAAVALVALGIAATTPPHQTRDNAAPRNPAGPASVGKNVTRSKTPATKTPAATLTAMTIVARPGALHAVGAVADSDNFLTCVTPSVCYIEGSTDGGRLPDVARSLNGGATWQAGEAVPGPFGDAFDWDASVSCPKPLTCFSAFGKGLLETSDGFARYTFQPVTLPAGLPGQLAGADQVSCPTTRHCVADVTLTDNSQKFIYSDDGGLTWAAASAPKFGVNNNVVGQVRCDRRGACIAAITGGDEETPTVSALASANGGRSWTMSGTYADPDLQTWTASCGSADSCLISGGTGTTYLAWLHVTASGGFNIRVKPIPATWATPSLVTGSCATGSDCYVETDGSSAGNYYGPMIETTRDGGLTWTSSPMYPPDQSEIGIYLSCPVPGGCIAVAGDSTEQSSTWVVLSNLRA